MTPCEFAEIEARANAADDSRGAIEQGVMYRIEVPSSFFDRVSASQRDVRDLLDTVRELHDGMKAAVELHRDLTGRLGYGDNIIEPQADNSTIVEDVDNLLIIERDHWECPRICELCGEQLAATVCEHCNGGGCLPNAEMAYRECGWCAGVGRVHVGCTEESYADLVAAVRERDNTIARVREVGLLGLEEIAQKSIDATVARMQDQLGCTPDDLGPYVMAKIVDSHIEQAELFAGPVLDSLRAALDPQETP